MNHRCRRSTGLMLIAGLLLVGGEAGALRYEMVFDDPSWSGWFELDPDSEHSTQPNRLLYTVTSFSFTNGVYVFDETDDYGDGDPLGAVADHFGNVGFFEYVTDDATGSIAQAVLSLYTGDGNYTIVGTYLSFHACCPLDLFGVDLDYTAVLAPEPAPVALGLPAALALGALGRRRPRAA